MQLTTRYLRNIMMITLLTLAVCALAHAIIDPYHIFGAAKREGFNKVKAVIGSKQRVFETVELLHRRPQVVILGTSRSDIGIDPQHPVFRGLTSFNAAASGQHIGEASELLSALVRQPESTPKIVVIGLDFMAFNALAPDPFDYDRANFSPWRKFQLLFSISTLLDSVRTLQRQNYEYQLGQGGLLRDDGFREYIGNPAMTRREQFEGSEEGFFRNTYNGPPHCRWSTVDAVRQRDYLEAFRTIIRVAHAHRIDLRLFISPSHARQWETLARSGLWGSFEQWKRDLVRMNAEEAKRANRPAFLLIDFSGYNSITSEKVSDAPDMKYYWESSHYRQVTGDMVLNRLFERQPYPADFGRVITTENLAAWLAETRGLQARYRASHSVDIADIHKLAIKAERTSPCAGRNLDQSAARR